MLHARGRGPEDLRTLRVDAEQLCLKVNRKAMALFNTIRHRCWELAVRGAT